MRAEEVGRPGQNGAQRREEKTLAAQGRVRSQRGENGGPAAQCGEKEERAVAADADQQNHARDARRSRARQIQRVGRRGSLRTPHLVVVRYGNAGDGERHRAHDNDHGRVVREDEHDVQHEQRRTRGEMSADGERALGQKGKPSDANVRPRPEPEYGERNRHRRQVIRENVGEQPREGDFIAKNRKRGER